MNVRAATSEDARLIDESLAGQSASFGQLVTKYQDRLFNMVVHVLGSPEDARDIVQDAFVQAMIKLESFRRDSAFYTWIYRIALNLAISHRRRRRPSVSVDHTSGQTGAEMVDDGEAPSDRLVRSQRAAQVREALGRLSDEHRTVLVLREVDGRCYEEIADILEVPVGTVRSRLHRARAQLGEELQDAVEQGKL